MTRLSVLPPPRRFMFLVGGEVKADSSFLLLLLSPIFPFFSPPYFATFDIARERGASSPHHAFSALPPPPPPSPSAGPAAWQAHSRQALRGAPHLPPRRRRRRPPPVHKLIFYSGTPAPADPGFRARAPRARNGAAEFFADFLAAPKTSICIAESEGQGKKAAAL